MLDSQGDDEQIFAHNPGASNQSLSVLKLSASVDDAAWVTDPSGAIYTTDNVGDAIHKITGPFVKGSELVAVTPCNDNKAPSTCSGSGYPQNYVAQLNPRHGDHPHSGSGFGDRAEGHAVRSLSGGHEPARTAGLHDARSYVARCTSGAMTWSTFCPGREIAQQLFVTRKTIETHLGHVYLKLDLKSRKELAYALSSQDAEQARPR